MRHRKEITDPKALLADGFTDVVIATGAWAHGDARLSYGEAVDALAFLEKAKNDPASFTGNLKQVVVIGGGNTAMDCARAAKRLDGVGHVRLVYRRDRRNMPADEEELVEALHDGVEFMELLSPVGVKDGKVLVSLTPNSTLCSLESAISRVSIGTASSHCRSSLK